MLQGFVAGYTRCLPSPGFGGPNFANFAQVMLSRMLTFNDPHEGFHTWATPIAGWVNGKT